MTLEHLSESCIDVRTIPAGEKDDSANQDRGLWRKVGQSLAVPKEEALTCWHSRDRTKGMGIGEKKIRERAAETERVLTHHDTVWTESH